MNMKQRSGNKFALPSDRADQHRPLAEGVSKWTRFFRWIFLRDIIMP